MCRMTSCAGDVMCGGGGVTCAGVRGHDVGRDVGAAQRQVQVGDKGDPAGLSLGS
jgi:hypothetical protein